MLSNEPCCEGIERCKSPRIVAAVMPAPSPLGTRRARDGGVSAALEKSLGGGCIVQMQQPVVGVPRAGAAGRRRRLRRATPESQGRSTFLGPRAAAPEGFDGAQGVLQRCRMHAADLRSGRGPGKPLPRGALCSSSLRLRSLKWAIIRCAGPLHGRRGSCAAVHGVPCLRLRQIGLRLAAAEEARLSDLRLKAQPQQQQAAKRGRSSRSA